MSIEHDKERRTYTVRWRELNTATGEMVSKKKRGFQTKKEAKAFEEYVTSVREFSSFEQLSEQYLASLKGYANNDTIQSKRRMLEMYASDLLPLNVKYLKKAEVMQWRSGLAEKEISVVTRNRAMQIVKAVLKYGQEIYDYEYVGTVLKPFPKSSDDVKEMIVLSPEEMANVAQNVPNEVYRRFFLFLYFTGMRRGEAMGLLKEDVNGRSVTIRQAVRRSSAGRKPLKNVASRRTILLTKQAYEAIRPLLETEGEYVFGEHAPLPASQISRYFEKGLTGAGLPHCRVHDLRHSFISNAILNGADIVTVSHYVGHANIEQTLNTYSHLLKDSEKKFVNILECAQKMPTE